MLTIDSEQSESANGDKKFTDKFGDNSETRVAGVWNHMKTFFIHSSLDVKFNLIRLPTKEIARLLNIRRGKCFSETFQEKPKTKVTTF